MQFGRDFRPTRRRAALWRLLCAVWPPHSVSLVTNAAAVERKCDRLSNRQTDRQTGGREKQTQTLRPTIERQNCHRHQENGRRWANKKKKESQPSSWILSAEVCEGRDRHPINSDKNKRLDDDVHQRASSLCDMGPFRRLQSADRLFRGTHFTSRTRRRVNYVEETNEHRPLASTNIQRPHSSAIYANQRIWPFDCARRTCT